MYHRDGSEIGQVLGGYVPHLSYDEGGVTESYSSADHGPVNIRRGVQTASQLCCKSATKNKTFGELDILACCSGYDSFASTWIHWSGDAAKPLYHTFPSLPR